MVFHALTFARSRGRYWKPRPEAMVFNISQGTWWMLMHCKNMFDRYYCIKTENICYILHYFLHYFVSPFHPYFAKAISADYAHSRAGEYTSRNGSKSVALVWSYWKLRKPCINSAWIALLIHSFSPVNAWLLITWDTAFYAIKLINQQTTSKECFKYLQTYLLYANPCTSLNVQHEMDVY